LRKPPSGGRPPCVDARLSDLKVWTKDEYMEIMEHHTELVQETYLCPEFKRHVSGTGYRG